MAIIITLSTGCVCVFLFFSLSSPRQVWQDLIHRPVWNVFVNRIASLTERKGQIVAHAKKLTETDQSLVALDVEFLHFFNGEPYCVSVVAGHHDADPLLLAETLLLQCTHAHHALL